MRAIIGLLLVVGGVCLGLYLGLWWALIGGIVTVIQQLKGNIDALTLAFAIVKIIFAGAIGWLSAFILILPGFGLIGSWANKH